jgi:hypothetical protein
MPLSISGPELREILVEIEGQYGVRFNREWNPRDGNCGYIVFKADCEDNGVAKMVHDYLVEQLSDIKSTVVLNDKAILAHVAVSSIEPYYYPN